jgi:hypothetical protein
MATDLEQLLDMGFDPERAAIAAKKTGNCKLFHMNFSISSFLIIFSSNASNPMVGG